MQQNNKLFIEIQYANYYEHFKFEKELAKIYGADDLKRIKLSEESNKILNKIKILQNEQ